MSRPSLFKQRRNVPTPSSITTSPASSASSSTSDLQSFDVSPSYPGSSRHKSLKERSRIPVSFYLTLGIVLSLQYVSGIYSTETLQRWYTSLQTSGNTTVALMAYLRDLLQAAVVGREIQPETFEYFRVALISVAVCSMLYVVVWAPFRAGLWTGTRARRHKFHRYMGLAYLLQYFCAWVEFFTNYENGGAVSYVPHFIAVNGLMQGMSAFVSFKVLPELDDSGYLSDKAVLSRNFIHENIFFSLMCFFGSLYYNEPTREAMRSHWVGKVLEYVFVFWPYVVLRTWFPTTRFKDAGKTRNGRTDRNQRFYEIATTMVKIFFLWAKYLIGFFTNFLVFLDLVQDWRFVHGLFLLNCGTVSIAVFLHTLRFKKVLPPRFTMSLYLGQIYLTFIAIPLAYEMFVSHLTLCSVCIAGLLCNMTRSRKIHAVWCFVVMALLGNTEYQWLSRQIVW